MDLDHERSFVILESFIKKSKQLSAEKPEKEEHYMVILDKDKEGYLDPNAQITLLN